MPSISIRARFASIRGLGPKQEAYADSSGLAYIMGPYERHYEADGVK